PPGMAHIALDQAAIGPADLGERLAGCEMDDLVDVHALVWLAPTHYGDMNHNGPSDSGNSGSKKSTEDHFAKQPSVRNNSGRYRVGNFNLDPSAKLLPRFVIYGELDAAAR